MLDDLARERMRIAVSAGALIHEVDDGALGGEAISASDAILCVTPAECNRSFPGTLKNAIDWASRPWAQKPFDRMPTAVIGAYTGVC
ncbi:hypothetical protein HDC95_002077 [Microbacterium sp. AK031]|nr:hypothetical protein [Microbacterium sp. AK031]